MNISHSTLQSLTASLGLNASQDPVSRSLARLSADTSTDASSTTAPGQTLAEKLAIQNRGIQAAATDVQNAASYVQTADGFLGGISDTLSRMSDLAGLANSATANASDAAGYQQEFAALQDQLRATIGGATSEIGGTADVASPRGSFNGVALFGAGSQGLALGRDVPVPAADLRSGTLGNLISQDASGTYSVAVTDSSASTEVQSAIQQVAAQRANLAAVSSRLGLASTRLSVESDNLGAVVSQVPNFEAATQATASVAGQFRGNAAQAHAAQANLSASSVLSLLQG